MEVNQSFKFGVLLPWAGILELRLCEASWALTECPYSLVYSFCILLLSLSFSLLSLSLLGHLSSLLEDDISLYSDLESPVSTTAHSIFGNVLTILLCLTYTCYNIISVDISSEFIIGAFFAYMYSLKGILWLSSLLSARPQVALLLMLGELRHCNMYWWITVGSTDNFKTVHS